jgi:hypothetical protein
MAYSQTYDVFNPEIWSSKLNRAFQKKLVAASFFDNYSSEIAGRGDLLWIPGLSNGFTATAIATSTGDIAPTGLSDTKSSMTIDQWMGTSFVMTDYQAKMVGSQYRLQEEYINKMGYALALKVDTDLLALGASITKVLNDSATSITATVLEQAIAFMESSSIPLSECAFIFHPNAYWKEVMGSDKLVNASKYGKVILPNPPHNELYGIPVYITANVPAGTAGTEGGHRNLLVHKNAIIYAMANDGVQITTAKGESLRTKYIADVMYAKKLLNAGSGVRIISNY